MLNQNLQRMDRHIRATYRYLERRFGPSGARLTFAAFAVGSIVALLKSGNLLHDLLCADHGTWPLL